MWNNEPEGGLESDGGEAPRAKAPPAAQEHVTPRQVGPRNRTVLLVDDEQLVRMVTRTILEQHGYEVETVADGEQAIAAVESTSFAAVLLDLTLPGMTGHDVLVRLKEHHPAVPVILSSGYPLEDQPPAELALADGVLQKPFSTADLLGVLRAATVK